MGRLTADPEVRYTQSNTPMAVCRFRIAVDRRQKKEGQPTADFINCVAFGKSAENLGKFFNKGSRILLTGHIQTGSYNDKDGKRVYTTDIVVDEWDFIDRRSDSQQSGFTDIPEDVDDSGLPFN